MKDYTMEHSSGDSEEDKLPRSVQGGARPTQGQVNSPTEGVYSPTEGVHSPTEGVHSPTEGVHSPMEGVNSPTEGVNSPGGGHRCSPQLDYTFCALCTIVNNVASFYGSSCANSGEDALNTPDRRQQNTFHRNELEECIYLRA
eukprot:197197-Prorocentrum_minimum.AAC.1